MLVNDRTQLLNNYSELMVNFSLCLWASVSPFLHDTNTMQQIHETCFRGNLQILLLTRREMHKSMTCSTVLANMEPTGVSTRDKTVRTWCIVSLYKQSNEETLMRTWLPQRDQKTELDLCHV